jgi:hypothetical protein
VGTAPKSAIKRQKTEKQASFEYDCIVLWNISQPAINLQALPTFKRYTKLFPSRQLFLRSYTMAKGARASTKKANNQKLKSRVFGPVESARTERLSAKLLELASQPKPKPAKEDIIMEFEEGMD